MSKRSKQKEEHSEKYSMKHLLPFLPRMWRYRYRFIVIFFLSLGTGFTASFSLITLKPVLEIMFSEQRLLPERKGAETEASAMDLPTTASARLVPADKTTTLTVAPGAVPDALQLERKTDDELAVLRDQLQKGSLGQRLNAIKELSFDYLAGGRETAIRYMMDNKMQAIYFIAGFLLFLRGSMALFIFLNGVISSSVALDLQKRLRQDVFDHILAQDMVFFGMHPTGNLIARLTNDIKKIQRMLLLFSENNLRNFIQMIFLFGVLVYISPKLTFFAVLTMPIAGGIYVWTGRVIRKFGAREDVTEAAVYTVLQEAFSGISVIKAFGGEKWEGKRFKHAIEVSFNRLFSIRKIESFVKSFSEFQNMLAVVVVLIVGARLFLDDSALLEDNFGTSDFFLYLIVITQFYQPARSLGRMNATLQRALAACHRINNIMTEDRGIKDAPDAVDISEEAPRVRFENVTFRYPTKPKEVILNDLSMDVKPGEVVALVGRSGAGKTSIINLLSRFYDPESGDIVIDDTNLQKIKIESLRRKVAIVPQETFLFDDTVRNNICYAYADASDEEVEEAARIAKAHDFIMTLPEGYQTMLGERGNSLSTGQKQRLAIARALIRKPTVLIFDEATASLDAETEKFIQENLRQMVEGRTTFIIAHRFSTVTVADRIMVVDKGRIVEQGAHRDLYEAGGLYTVLCKCQEIF